ncbi:DUF1499 domain-containing protein [Photobacterium atrarenae]|uniref:DUF1499 domain-containing protein n=1 Tax=Photobacterium atrarenae TaxID=865757 RepID=A0ABY5GEN3_9GAMM|nr:DUF1499 domain-containing protein [Photobacterium atrarenae]UTV27072.1 DUF1499 domain-containing protein [Photobacterium atrarenae]
MTNLSRAAMICLLITGCSNGEISTNRPDRTSELCGEKPNCVSTQDPRTDFHLTPFKLSQQGLANWAQIQELALSLPGASLGQQHPHYLRVACRSKIFRFVDDFELRLAGDALIVRSESRVGYSDFGVNRDRAELFRAKLQAAGYLK